MTEREKNLLFFIFGHNAFFCVIFCVKINLIFRQASCLHPLWNFLQIKILRPDFQNFFSCANKLAKKQKLLWLICCSFLFSLKDLKAFLLCIKTLFHLSSSHLMISLSLPLTVPDSFIHWLLSIHHSSQSSPHYPRKFSQTFYLSWPTQEIKLLDGNLPVKLFFLMLALLRRASFATTFYGLYFNHQTC